MSNAPKKSIPRPGRKPAAPESATAPTPSTAAQPSESQQIALLAARAGLDKKATGVEIIDVMGKVDYADYLVLMTGASDRNVAAIAQEVDGALSKAGFRSMSVEGLPAAQWVLIDFVDVVVHVFQKDVRSLYDLDGLWMDAERVPMQTDAVTGAVDSSDVSPAIAASPRSRAKATKRPTKKAKAVGSKAAARRSPGGAASSARGSSAQRGAASRSSAGGRAGSSRTASGSARGPARSSTTAKPARKSKASKGAK